jgi:phosphodiester glycosidase/flagellar hook capping protein FlgD
MPRLPRRLIATSSLVAVLVVPASAAPVELMPGVSYDTQVLFTPRGPVAITVITSPPPGPLTTIGPVVAGGTMTGPRLKLTQIQRSFGPTAITAGISGDYTASSGVPNGIVIANGAYQHAPTAGRSSIGIETDGTLHVTRFSFVGTWKGSGQRRPLAGINHKPKGNQTMLFTPAWGATTPDLPNATAVVLQPFPATTPNTDLQATVVSVGAGQTQIPTDGAVLVANGTEAAKLENEATTDTSVTVRLILPASWSGVTNAIGGGPLLVRNRKAVFRTSENFAANELAARDARAGIGQLDDGRLLLVTVDGGRPGHSVGMTTYELAQTMVRLGAVTAAALESGKAVTAAFQGTLLNRPSGAAEKPLREALLVQYAGVYAAPPSVLQITKANQGAVQRLSYSVVRPTNVTAELVAPDGTSRPIDSGSREPGTYTSSASAFDVEGTWRWKVTGTDDQSRQSVAEQPFLVDYTVSALKVPKVAHTLTVGFGLSRPAGVTLQIETPTGAIVKTLPAAELQAGTQSLVWDDTTASGATAPPGSYVARLIVTSPVGTSNVSARFSLRR